jgi:hypothetical protein
VEKMTNLSVPESLAIDISKNVQKYRKLNKNYQNIKFKKLPLSRQLRIKEMLRVGYGVYEIMKKERILVSCLLQVQAEVQKSSSRMMIGSKTEEYATEEEMLTEFKCTYDDLSEQEKNIYNLT